MKRIIGGILCLSLSISAQLSLAADERKKAIKSEFIEIERGRWSVEDATFPHRKNYRLLCVDGLQFLSMEGYGGGQSSSTAVHIIQVYDKSGKPKGCK